MRGFQAGRQKGERRDCLAGIQERICLHVVRVAPNCRKECTMTCHYGLCRFRGLLGLFRWNELVWRRTYSQTQNKHEQTKALNEQDKRRTSLTTRTSRTRRREQLLRKRCQRRCLDQCQHQRSLLVVNLNLK